MVARKCSILGGLLVALAIGVFSSPVKAQDCYEEVCIQFIDVAGYHLLTVTGASSGQPLEVQMTEVPSSIPPHHVPPGDGGWLPPVQPHAAPGFSRATGDGHGVLTDGPQVPPSQTYEYTFHGPDGYWIVAITLSFDLEGNLAGVSANVTYVSTKEQMD